MNKHNILFIGLDTHKEFIEVAYIEDQRGAKPVHLGRQPTSKVAIKRFATGVVAELGDLSRFDHPRKLMSYVGLVSSEVCYVRADMYDYLMKKPLDFTLPFIFFSTRTPRYWVSFISLHCFHRT